MFIIPACWTRQLGWSGPAGVPFDTGQRVRGGLLLTRPPVVLLGFMFTHAHTHMGTHTTGLRTININETPLQQKIHTSQRIPVQRAHAYGLRLAGCHGCHKSPSMQGLIYFLPTRPSHTAPLRRIYRPRKTRHLNTTLS